ncbi:tyrosine-type recombinase/integrase [Staphylococcus hominis]|uniref:tyrosine-type recombinase/integrase n=1 Tax=Staphylococcus hominis TaxID=1290 RepID=UPI002DD67B92|nr:site-specific integrase [Staphylococcus hominis]WRY66449.1 site-specific integrase [Staphylococcus hominis]
MWCEQFTDKHGKLRYRFYEKYKDPLTNKWRRISVVLNKNGKQSQKEAQKRLTEQIESKTNNINSSILKNLTFHSACDEWLEYYKLMSGSKQTTIKNRISTINIIKNTIDKNVLIERTTSNYLQNIINNWAKKYSYGYLYSLLTILRLIYKYIFKKYDMDISFLSKIDIPKKVMTREELKTKKNNYLEEKEIKELLNCLDFLIKQTNNTNKKYDYKMIKSLVIFQVNNGMRIGELLAIKTNNIDFDHKILTINGTINWVTDKKRGGFGIKETTKTNNSNRKINLTNNSVTLLKKLILQNKKNIKWNDKYIDRGFIFTNSKGNPLKIYKINKIIKEAIEISSIKKKVTTHTLRHTHISILTQLGVNIKTIQERVGHSDYKTTLSIYTHVTEKMAKDMIDKLENIDIG